MTDSAANTPEANATPKERPSWRFSGRRGTPVHLRERTPANLPPEIRQAVAQMAREQASEQPQAPVKAPTSRVATSTLKLGGDHATPPVAGAPMPVERRTGAPEQVVTTTPPEAVPAPAAMEPVELPSEADAVAIADSQLELDTTPPPLDVAADEPETPAEHEAPAPPEPAQVPIAESADEDVVEDDASTDDATPTPAAPPRAQLAPAERRKRAKARAKARAKSSKSKSGEREAKRRLFAKGREVDPATEQVAIEPAPPVEAPEPAPTPEPTPTPDPAPVTELEPAAVTTSPEPVGEIADIDLGTAAAESTPLAAAIEMPEPRMAPESASQAAWELGRLPILLAPTSAPAAPAPIDEQLEPELVIPSGAGARRLPAMDWAPVDGAPEPAPIEPSTTPSPTPDVIAQLEDTSRFVAHVTRARDADAAASSRSVTETRQRIARRRRELDELVASLGELAERVGR